MSETLEPALPDDLDERAERLMNAACDRLARARAHQGAPLYA